MEKRKVQDLETALGRLRKDIDKFSFAQKRELLRPIVPGDKIHCIIANPDKSLDVNGVIDFKRLSEPELRPTGTDYSGFGLSRTLERLTTSGALKGRQGIAQGEALGRIQ